MSSTSQITASGQLGVGDLYRYSLATLWRRFWFFLIIMVLCAAYVPYSLFVAGQTWEWAPNVILGVAFPFVLTPYAFFISPYLGAKKLLKTNPNLQGTLQYIFSDQGIEASGPHSHGHLDWSAISEARESATQFLLHPHRAVAHVIPKRFLASVEDQLVLRELLKKHVPKARLKAV
jgi:YcxB-like protein